MKEYTRHEERVRTMNAFYQVFLFLENHEEIDASQILMDQYGVNDISEVPLFSKALFSLGLDHFDEIVALVSSHLRNWTFERLDDVAKAILFVGIADGNYAHLSPRNVIINECIKLAKDYLKAGDHRFINAVLDKSLVKDNTENA